MSNSKLSNFVNATKSTLIKHSPEILTGLGIAGMITSTVLAVKATPKALKKIEEYKKENELEHEKLPPLDVVKLTWKEYVPTAVTTVVSTACLIGASSVNAKRNATLAAAYKLSETALSEYRDAVVETIGEKKEQAVHDKAAKAQLEKNPVSKNEVVDIVKGTHRCYDPLSGRHFLSDVNKIKKAQNDLNEQMINTITGYVSLNDFYDEIGLPHIEIGDNLGWTTDNLIDIYISAQVDDDGAPSLVLEYRHRPLYEYMH